MPPSGHNHQPKTALWWWVTFLCRAHYDRHKTDITASKLRAEWEKTDFAVDHRRSLQHDPSSADALNMTNAQLHNRRTSTATMAGKLLGQRRAYLDRLRALQPELRLRADEDLGEYHIRMGIAYASRIATHREQLRREELIKQQAKKIAE